MQTMKFHWWKQEKKKKEKKTEQNTLFTQLAIQREDKF